MKKLLRPDLYVPSTRHIDFDYLKAQGIKGICFDLDNTLVPWDAKEPPTALLLWLKEIREAGFSLFLVSNAVTKRLLYFAGLLGIEGIAKAGKPRKKAFKRALKELNLPAHQVALVGDQLFTDVLGGNRMGLFTVLVSPLSKQEFVGTRFMRILERMVMRHWK